MGLACFLFLAAFHHGHLRGTDEVGLLQTTRSLFDAGSLAVPRMVHTGKGADGRYYSHFAPGQPALALPFFALGRLGEALLPESAVRAMAGPDRWLRQLRVGGRLEIFAVGFYGPAVAGLLVAVFFLFQRALGTAVPTAVACALALGSCTYLATQSTFFLRHGSESLTILGGLYGFFRWKREGRWRHLWLGSALASLTLLVRFPASVAGPALGAYLGWCLWLRGGRRFDPALWRRALPAIGVPLAAALVLSAGADLAKWGRPWNVHQLRTASSLHTPLGVGLYGFLFSPGASVFAYTPLLLLAPWCMARLWRERRAEAVACLGLVLSFLLVFSRFTGWTGLWSSPGPRYQLLAVPLLLLPLGLWLDRSSRAAWVAASSLAALGLCIQLALMSVSWGGLVDAEGYRESRPKFAFLFQPEQSPVWDAARHALRGEPADLWIRALWVGSEERPGAPGAAGVVAAVWLAALAATLLGIARGVRARGRGALG